jgi:hypothetical protein
MEGEALLAEDVQPYAFEIKWDKVLKKYSITVSRAILTRSPKNDKNDSPKS